MPEHVVSFRLYINLLKVLHLLPLLMVTACFCAEFWIF